MKIRILMIAASLVILTRPFFSFAADTCGKKGQEVWDCPSSGPLIAWDAPLAAKNEVQVQPYFFYNRTRGVFDEEGSYKSYKNKERKWQWQEALFLQYGLTERLEISVWGEAQQNIRHAEGYSAESSDFADTYMWLRCCFLDQTRYLPQTTAIFQFKFPTGKYRNPDDGKLGTDLTGSMTDPGAYDQGYGIVLTKCIKPLKIHADFLYNTPNLTKIDGVKVRYGNYANFDFAVEWILPKGFNLLWEMNFIAQGDRKDDGVKVPASDLFSMVVCPGIGWANDRVEALLAYQRTLAGVNVDVNDSIVFTFVLKF
jgi:hypothetical protein